MASTHFRMRCLQLPVAVFLLFLLPAQAQVLGMKEAVEQAVQHYGTIRSKQDYADAAQARVDLAKRDYLPNVNISGQQVYGTANGQLGPMYGLGGLGVASSGLPTAEQSWDAAYGALYVANINWEFFAFGRNRRRIAVAGAEAGQLDRDLGQEVFAHEVKVADAYLNLLAGQRLTLSQQRNLERVLAVRDNIVVRARSGMLPGVDSTMADAEVSNARIVLNKYRAEVRVRANHLAQLMGTTGAAFGLDSTFLFREPAGIDRIVTTADSAEHPLRRYFRSRIDHSAQLERLYRKDALPAFSLFGIYQTRASGIGPHYATDPGDLTMDYARGVTPTRANYLLGVGLVWNLTSLPRTSKRTASQQLITAGLEEEYKAIDTELRTRDDAANAKLILALANYREAPEQVRASYMAYAQQLALYNNGLADLTDVITAQYALNRSETDADIAAVDLWRSLLLKAAAVGDFGLFIDQF